ncbi:protein of unknown function [Thauera humireducens]|nr:protein of unknown function [Thauera humireducens]
MRTSLHRRRRAGLKARNHPFSKVDIEHGGRQGEEGRMQAPQSVQSGRALRTACAVGEQFRAGRGGQCLVDQSR